MNLVDLVDMDLDKEIVSDLGYTRKELDDAFKLIADSDNWKMPIKALVDQDDLEVSTFLAALHEDVNFDLIRPA